MNVTLLLQGLAKEIGFWKAWTHVHLGQIARKT